VKHTGFAPHFSEAVQVAQPIGCVWVFAFRCDAEQALHSGALLWTFVNTVAEVIVGKMNLSLQFQVHGGGIPQGFNGRPLDCSTQNAFSPFLA
jgi:hypothetical protein